MITSEQRVENWKALRGQVCRCGMRKPQGHPLCANCVARLPKEISGALFEHIEHNYDERYAEAVAFLEQRREIEGSLLKTMSRVFAEEEIKRLAFEEK